ncbi:hypothetical protein BDE36_2192 [Arcticibacter tournemirensis]|uniref:Lipoprotein n=1 Tax=Arcticibacter tournemirensis TaxID=699437 RepID=A0A5M9HEQ2_9SPHI|nr:hypothetical protein [Arcticibacter tournemirensis]KAA8485270.1 hypothetical protein F1649_03895 [Arcticibacter tournemirensis]TQM50446.1 hypothetical protein BDE36_2192 [Arcticibacter tournemirensis]
MTYKNTFLITLAIGIVSLGCGQKSGNTNGKKSENALTTASDSTSAKEEEESKPVDTAAYNQKLKEIANGDTTGRWPVIKQPYPLAGAILPFKRIVAYYGNLYSKRMGALGEYPPKEMLSRLNAEVKRWEKADPKTPVQPALHYIAVVAQGDGGKDGKYRTRMPHKQIDSVLKIAEKGKAIVFLDIQVALSNIKAELPLLEEYLKMPHVHLGIDPEFSMKTGAKPGTRIGTFDAADINYCSEYLAKLVRDNNLPPKVFTVHRFTKKMVTNSQNIKLRPEVQIVMHMDGWGEPELKKGTYRHWIFPEPVQFTGFKLFYKNDIKKAPHRMMTPEELLKLKPQPIYIQYQ